MTHDSPATPWPPAPHDPGGRVEYRQRPQLPDRDDDLPPPSEPVAELAARLVPTEAVWAGLRGTFAFQAAGGMVRVPVVARVSARCERLGGTWVRVWDIDGVSNGPPVFDRGEGGV